MSVSVDFTGIPGIQKMLGGLEGRELQNRSRRALRAGGAVFRKRMRAAGKMGWPKRPRSFNKSRTRNHRIPLGVSVSPQSPLSNIYEHGASRHAIPITTGPFAGRTVQHPGVRARPFIVPIFEQAKSEATDAVADTLVEGL